MKRKFDQLLEDNSRLLTDYYLYTIIFSNNIGYNEMAMRNLRPKKRKVDEKTPLETNSDWEEFYNEQLLDESISPQRKGSIFEKECMRKLRKLKYSCTLSKAMEWHKVDPDQFGGKEFILEIIGDHGIDAIGSKNDIKYIAQFKRHAKPVTGVINNMIGLLSKYKGFIGLIIAPNGISEREETLLGECQKINNVTISLSYPIVVAPQIDQTLDQCLPKVIIPQEILEIHTEEWKFECYGDLYKEGELLVKGSNKPHKFETKSSKTIYKKY
jgi:hypothetical protein